MKTMNNKTWLFPNLRFPEFSESWEGRRVGELGELAGGGTPSKGIIKYWKGGIPWISSSDIDEDSVHKVLYSRFITQEAITNSATKLIPKSSVLIVSRVGVGKIAINDRSVCTSQDFTNITPDSVDVVFLAYLLKGKKSRLLRFNQGTSIKGFTRDDLDSLVLHIPPTPEEQRKIALFLTTIDNKIAHLQKKVDFLKKYKKGVMQKIFSQEIRFKDENGKDHVDWEEKKAGEIFDNYVDKNHSGNLPLLAVTQERGVVYRSDLDLKINSSEKGIKNYKVINPGNFVISLRSFQGGIEHSRIRGISSPAYTILKNKVPISDYYYKLLFKQERFIKKLNSLIYGIRDGKQISYSEFKTMNLPYPSINEQKRIAEFLASIDNKISLEERQLAGAKRFKKFLLQQMFV